MRSSLRSLKALLSKERRELAASRSYLLLLVVLGPLVGHAFVTAVDSYAEASGAAGGPAALAQGLSPLDGLVVPTLGAYALAGTLLFPFVAIRLVSAEKETGSLKLLLQAPTRLDVMLALKLAVLLLAWIVAWTPGFVALLLWRAYGGHLHAPEVSGVLLGHFLHAAWTCAVAFVAAAIADGAAAAAVATLAVTLGGWAIDFYAQVHGGVARQLAAYTPELALRTFESGEIRLSVIVATLVLTVGSLGLATLWLHPGRRRRVRAIGSMATVAAMALLTWGATMLRPSWDVSEDRRNSFSPAVERALAGVREPLRVTVHLAPEDPRLADLERGVLKKLRRTVPHLRVDYAARTSTGLFERAGAGSQYGEVWYSLGVRRAMSRSTTEPIVLETIFGLSGLTPPATGDTTAYSGYPLIARPRAAAGLFYFVWPVLLIAGWIALRLRRSRSGIC
jgi:ABC-type transport system involved in multi-copper enzyme maturation permease subunit